jgi:tetratricopeptide (TPR) repeat protein
MGLFSRKSKEEKEEEMIKEKCDELKFEIITTKAPELRLKFCDELLKFFHENKIPESFYPSESDAYDYKSACLYQLKRYEESLECAEQSISLRDGYIRNPRKAYLLNYLERYEESLEWLNLYEKEHNIYQKGTAYYAPTNTKDSEASRDGASFIEPKVIAMYKVGKPKEEILSYLYYVTAQVDQDSFNENIRQPILDHLQEIEEGIEMLFNAVRITPDVYNETKKFIRNRKDNGEEILPEDVPIVIFNRAVMEYSVGSFSSARDGFYQVLEYDPNDDEAINFIEKCNKKLSED